MRGNGWIALGLLVASCTDLNNEVAGREMQLADLSSYGLSAGPDIRTRPYFITTEMGAQPASVGDWLFADGGGVWVARGGDASINGATDLVFTHHAADGGVIEQRTIDMASYGYEGYSFVSSVTGDELGRGWIVLNADSSTDIVGVDLATGTLVARHPTIHRFGYPWVTAAYAGGKLYVAARSPNALVAIDPNTGVTVQDYADSVVMALDSEGSAIIALAVQGSVLLVRPGRDDWGASMPPGDAVLFDLATGAVLGEASGFLEGALAADATSFLSVDAVGTVSKRAIGATPLPDLALEQVVTLDRAGASAIAFSRGLLWVLYGGTETPVLVAYDPDSLETAEGFALDSETLASLSSAGWLTYTLAANDDAFYIQPTVPSMGSPASAMPIHVIDFETGKLRAVFSPSADVINSGICLVDDTLWAIEIPRDEMGLCHGRPLLHELDAANGLRRAIVSAPMVMTGNAGLVCDAGLLSFTTDASRVWASLDPAAPAEAVLSTVPFSTTGRSGFAADGKLWLLDEQRNLIFVLTTPRF